MQIIHNLCFGVSNLYTKFYGFLLDKTGISIRGAGFIARLLVKKARIIELNKGIQIYVDPNKINVWTYGRLLGNSWNEPETNHFIESVASKFNIPITFIDVGANIGEIVSFVAKSINKVNKIIAFEPIKNCAYILRKNLALNDFVKNVEIIEKVVKENNTAVYFHTDEVSQNVSSISSIEGEGELMEATTLDEMMFYKTNLNEDNSLHIILIDVEGGELRVLQGGKNYIELKKPIIIFEYNKVSKTFFTLDEVQNQLGSEYTIFRLRKDGLLDSDFSNSWNCVALSQDSCSFLKAMIIR